MPAAKVHKRKSASYKTIDFDAELDRGSEAYNRVVGEWWYQQSLDGPHSRAYRNVARHLRSYPRKTPATILDYGCGPGHLLTRLCREFPKSKIIGVDGSARQLGIARNRLQRLGCQANERVQLIETGLPNFSLPRALADVVVYCLPHIVCVDKDRPNYNRNGYRHKGDAAVARYLSKAREPDPEEETVTDKPEDLRDFLLLDKVISRNLRHLVKRGGLCFRVEYANATRQGLTELGQHRSSFEDGSLEISLNGHKIERIFRFLRSTYFRSRVVEDVYHQTGDEDDKAGGYTINILQAI